MGSSETGEDGVGHHHVGPRAHMAAGKAAPPESKVPPTTHYRRPDGRSVDKDTHRSAFFMSPVSTAFQAAPKASAANCSMVVSPRAERHRITVRCCPVS